MSIPKAGALEKASDWSTVFPLDTDAWTTYTPTWTQSATISKTVGVARYTKVGRWVVVNVDLTATSGGTAANALAVSLPFAAASGGVCGSFLFFDSGTQNYTGTVSLGGGSSANFFTGGAGVTTLMGATGGGFTAAVATNDRILFVANYEATS